MHNNDIIRFAQSEQTILITGETGTGKTKLAENIHLLSKRSDQPFKVINLGCSNSNLIDSELFGHEKGAYSGAEQKRIGKLEASQGGTVFLDEIGELPIALQTKILRLLNEKVINPLGSNRDIKLDLRIICATNKNLQECVADGEFREDLYYRINSCQIDLPSIAQQADKFEQILKTTLYSAAKKIGKDTLPWDEGFFSVAKKYNWPGNFRELQNALEFCLTINRHGVLQEADFPAYIRKAISDKTSQKIYSNQIASLTSFDYYCWKAKAEKDFLYHALKEFNGKINLTARKTNLSKVTLIEKIKKYQISVDGIKAENFINNKNSGAIV
jgi:DNA-binding NtrC family response regulator